MADIEPFRVVEMLTRAGELQAAGVDVVHMEAGEPDFPTLPQVVAAAKAASFAALRIRWCFFAFIATLSAAVLVAVLIFSASFSAMTTAFMPTFADLSISEPIS